MIKKVTFVLLMLFSSSVHAVDAPVGQFTPLNPLEGDLPNPATGVRFVDQINSILLDFRRDILAGGKNVVPEFMASDTCFCRAAALASALLKTNETIPDEFKVQLNPRRQDSCII